MPEVKLNKGSGFELVQSKNKYGLRCTKCKEIVLIGNKQQIMKVVKLIVDWK